MDGADGIRLGIVRGISHGLFAPPAPFMEPMRALGARLARVFLTWNQIEPQPGTYDWGAVDALLADAKPGDQFWITVVTSSRWATRQGTDFLPASSPRDMAAFQLFVGALVSRCRGVARYWQCNNEPSNPALWSGSAVDYAELADVFARTVRNADPEAKLVLGGCGHDVLTAEPGAAPLLFFEDVLTATRSSFDLFDIHLYDDPRRIAAHVAMARRLLKRSGCSQKLVVGEYGGPTVLGFPAVEPVMKHVMADATTGGTPSLDSADLSTAGDETPDRRAMRALYDRMADLPPELQMFMQGCPPALEAKRHRIACREVVTRTLLALAEGIEVNCYWNLAPEVPNYRDRLNMMGFVSDKLALMDFVHGELKRREPAADSFERLAACLRDARSVRRIDSEPPGLVAIEIVKPSGSVIALWREADAFDGEDEPPTLIDWPWDRPTARVTDVFGMSREMMATERRLSVGVGVTPLLIAPAL